MKSALLAAAALLLAALPASAATPAASTALELQQAAPCGYHYRCETDFRTGKRSCYRVPCVQKRTIPG